MAEHKVAATFDDAPRRNQTATLLRGEPARQKTTKPAGAVVEHAMKCARLEVKQLAGAMGITESILLRGFKDIESISWQRLQRAGDIYPSFKRWLLRVQAADTEGVRGRWTFDIEDECL